ncbi:DUF1007 family protein [Inquilinus limosus]|nr:DUF1007 family protein [Inquilinus limosus]
MRKGGATGWPARLVSIGPTIATLILPSVAAAHPHAWIDLRSAFLLQEDGRIAAVEEQWLFDDFYTSAVFESESPDDRPTPEAVTALARTNLRNLEPYDYFTRIRANGQAVPLGTVTDFESTLRNGRIWLRFVVPLAEPIDPRAKAVTLKIFDPTYYIDMRYVADDPVALRGVAAEGCGARVVPADPPAQAVAMAAVAPRPTTRWARSSSRPCRSPADDLAAGLAVSGARRRGPGLLALAAIRAGLPPALTAQDELHRRLAAALRAVQADGATVWGLVALSFAHGVFHAVGPGHGKAVISTYLATQRGRPGDALLLAALSSLTQGVAAILMVELAIGLFGLPFRQAEATGNRLEAVGFALVAVMGAYLALSHGRRLWRVRRGMAAYGACGHDHGWTSHPAEDAAGSTSLRRLLGVVASVGIRPCSGAVLVLVLARALQLRWTGIAAVLAMSAGTAVTVYALALLSRHARGASLRLMASLSNGSARQAAIADAVGLLGGLILLALGLLLMQAVLSMPSHPLH